MTDETTDEKIVTSERDPSGKLHYPQGKTELMASPAGGDHRRSRQSPAYEERRPAYRDQDEPVPKGDAGPRY
jgi:hypothetical protein